MAYVRVCWGPRPDQCKVLINGEPVPHVTKVSVEVYPKDVPRVNIEVMAHELDLEVFAGADVTILPMTSVKMCGIRGRPRPGIVETWCGQEVSVDKPTTTTVPADIGCADCRGIWEGWGV